MPSSRGVTSTRSSPGSATTSPPAPTTRASSCGGTARPTPPSTAIASWPRRYSAWRREAADEREDAPPGVGRGIGVLVGLSVEEAVRRTVVGDQVVLDPGGAQRLLEFRDVLGRDALVGAAEQAEDRTSELVRHVRRRRHACAPRSDRPAVKADRSGQRQVGTRGGQECQPAAETEA